MIPKPVDIGQFPPCPGVTNDEISAMRTLTNYGDGVFVAEEHKGEIISRDQHIVNVLGRIALWCRAYHERIGIEGGEAE